MRMCTPPSDDPLLQDTVVCWAAHGLHFLGGVGHRLRAITDEGDFTPGGAPRNHSNLTATRQGTTCQEEDERAASRLVVCDVVNASAGTRRPRQANPSVHVCAWVACHIHIVAPVEDSVTLTSRGIMSCAFVGSR